MMSLDCEEYVSGHEFLDTFDSSRPGCIVMEVRVPGINGLQIQQRLVEQGVTLPVLFLSEGPKCFHRRAHDAHGALHFLEKPFRENDLWTAIQEAIQVDQRTAKPGWRDSNWTNASARSPKKKLPFSEMIAAGPRNSRWLWDWASRSERSNITALALMRKLDTATPAGLLRLRDVQAKSTGVRGPNVGSSARVAVVQSMTDRPARSPSLILSPLPR